MMVEIVAAGNRLDLVETKVIIIGLFERKNHIHKVFTKLYYIGKPGGSCEGDHRFSGPQGYFTNLLKFIYQMVKEANGAVAFPV